MVVRDQAYLLAFLRGFSRVLNVLSRGFNVSAGYPLPVPAVAAGLINDAVGEGFCEVQNTHAGPVRLLRMVLGFQ